jgi:hypothetical protein
LAIVTNVGTGCGGRGSVGREVWSQGGLSVSDRRARRTNDAASVSPMLRRVCTPRRKPLGRDGSRTVKPCGPGTRCWCQVGGGFASPTGPDKTIQSVDDGDKTNSSPGRARSKPFKPLRREGRTVSAEPVVTPPVHFFRTGDRGCGERPVFPAPSAFRGARDGITPGAIRAAGRRSHIC